MIETTTHVPIIVADQDKALQFYTEVLGFEKRADYQQRGRPRWLTVAPKGQDVEFILVKGTYLVDPRPPAHAESGGNQQQLQTKLRELLGRILGAGENAVEKNQIAKVPDEFIGATDGSAAGLIAYVKQLEPLYDEATRLLTLSWPGYQAPTAEFERKLATHPNVLARQFLPALGKARAREFPLEAKYAMFQAAIAYKVGGEEAFKAVNDPFGDGPFTFQRFVLDGIDRGFQLQSKLNCRGFDETLILIEKPGPAVRIDFKNAGEKIP